MKYLFCIAILVVSNLTFCQIEGDWHSSFKVMGSPQRLDISVEHSSEITIELSFPDFEKSKAIAATEVQFNDDTLSFTAAELNAKYKGVYNANKKLIIGKLKQNGMSFDITFTRDFQEKQVLNRPQEPQGKPNYKVEALQYKSTFSDIALDVEITFPNEFSENTPIIIMASGSGPQDKDETMLDHKPFLVIADYLTKKGNIVVRFDDRGTGKSEGNFTKASLQDFATDVLSMIEMMKSRTETKNNPIGIAGHSEGGMHSLLATKKSKDIDFLVFLSCVGTTGREVLVEQNYLIAKKSGETEEDARREERIMLHVSEFIYKYDKAQAQDSITDYLTKAYNNSPKKIDIPLMQYIWAYSAFNSDYGRQFISFETKDYLKKFKGPVYAVNNEMDIQVPAVSNSEGFENAISKKSAKQNPRIYIEPGLNHLFQTCEKCTLEEYGELEETFSYKVLEDLAKWIKTQYP